MNKDVIQGLLYEWEKIIEIGERTSIEKADKNHDGLSGRILRTVGKPVIFDQESNAKQQVIQKSLCKEIPEWADLIRSQPEIMDGHNWTRKDFIELYFEHFRLVVEKLRRIITRADTV